MPKREGASCVFGMCVTETQKRIVENTVNAWINETQYLQGKTFCSLRCGLANHHFQYMRSSLLTHQPVTQGKKQSHIESAELGDNYKQIDLDGVGRGGKKQAQEKQQVNSRRTLLGLSLFGICISEILTGLLSQKEVIQSMFVGKVYEWQWIKKNSLVLQERKIKTATDQNISKHITPCQQTSYL